MANKRTNIDLLNHAIAYKNAKVPYMWGTFGRVLTEEKRQELIKKFPDYYNQDNRAEKSKAFVGKITTDCVGLIMSAYLTKTIGSAVTSFSNDAWDEADCNVGKLFTKCFKTGKISTIPKIPGTLVFRGTEHVGVYDGKNTVYEAKGFKSGTVASVFDPTLWTSWGWCKWFEYPAYATVTPATKPTAPGKPTTPAKPVTPKAPVKPSVKQRKIKVIAIWLNIRKTANGAETGKRVVFGETYTVLETSNDKKLREWVRINDKGKAGWIIARYTINT